MTTALLASLLPLSVVIPFAGAVAAPLLARLSQRLPLVVSVVALAAAAVPLALAAPRVFTGTVLVHYLGHWAPVHGAVLGIGFAADPFGLVFALAFVVVGGLLLVSTLSQFGGLGKHELGGYACLFQLLIGALVGSALTADLFNLFVWFEVAALSSYGLTGFLLERPVAAEAAFKILVLTTLASFALFVGIGLLYADHGALNLAQLHDALAGGTRTPDRIALGLLVAGFATKAGLMPFHGWLPDAHTAAPGPVSALFSGLMVSMGVLAIARLVFQVYGPGSTAVLGVLMVLGVASALLGAVLALAQDDLKRLLAYDTISQMGVIVVGLATGTAAGAAGATYHFVNHALFKSLLFLCAGAIVHANGVERLSEMGGLARRMPVVTAAFVLGVLSIVGIPPFNSYVSLGLIHDGLHESHHEVAYVLMLIAQVIAIAALGRATWLAFFRRRPRAYERKERLRAGMITALSGLGACCVASGVLPEQLLGNVVAPAQASLLHGSAYAGAVLDAGSAVTSGSVPFHYGNVEELVTVAVSVVLAAALALCYLRIREPLPVRALRALHTGSVNDYAAYAAGGMVVVVAVLGLLTG
ncbi:MAG TPA: proton-conducting transporter membrane subunit [Streptosporangiales bacterium]